MVAVNYRSSEAQALEVVDAITSSGGRAAAIGGDVSDYEQAQAAVAQTVERTSVGCTSWSTTPESPRTR